MPGRRGFLRKRALLAASRPRKRGDGVIRPFGQLPVAQVAHGLGSSRISNAKHGKGPASGSIGRSGRPYLPRLLNFFCSTSSTGSLSKDLMLYQSCRLRAGVP